MKLFSVCCLLALQLPIMGADFSLNQQDSRQVRKLTVIELNERLNRYHNLLSSAEREMDVIAPQLGIRLEETPSIEYSWQTWARVTDFYKLAKTIDTFPADFDQQMLTRFNARVERIKAAIR